MGGRIPARRRPASGGRRAPRRRHARQVPPHGARAGGRLVLSAVRSSFGGRRRRGRAAGDARRRASGRSPANRRKGGRGSVTGSRSKTAALAAPLVAGVLTLVPWAQAGADRAAVTCDTSWLGGGGQWTDATNWSSGGPGSSGTANDPAC